MLVRIKWINQSVYIPVSSLTENHLGILRFLEVFLHCGMQLQIYNSFAEHPGRLYRLPSYVPGFSQLILHLTQVCSVHTMPHMGRGKISLLCTALWPCLCQLLLGGQDDCCTHRLTSEVLVLWVPLQFTPTAPLRRLQRHCTHNHRFEVCINDW